MAKKSASGLLCGPRLEIAFGELPVGAAFVMSPDAAGPIYRKMRLVDRGYGHQHNAQRIGRGGATTRIGEVLVVFTTQAEVQDALKRQERLWDNKKA